MTKTNVSHSQKEAFIMSKKYLIVVAILGCALSNVFSMDDKETKWTPEQISKIVNLGKPEKKKLESLAKNLDISIKEDITKIKNMNLYSNDKEKEENDYTIEKYEEIAKKFKILFTDILNDCSSEVQEKFMKEQEESQERLTLLREKYPDHFKKDNDEN